ncbi:MAG: N-acetylmuramoyl-L-alanine amidase [Verrucomicrobiales bacterium]|jgi:N-acetylmuramoyl-L-alanine amidase
MEETTRPRLSRGDVGDSVVELHKQLTIAGYLVETVHLDRFGSATHDAVVAFQKRRGLEGSGVVGGETWKSLTEAAHNFGERLLCRRTPMMRGDDVAELQLLLGSLGFDTGWIDGIFGPETETAVGDFQRNAGVPVDGVAGPTTIETLTRLRLSANAARPVAAIREQERLRNGPKGFVGRRIVVGDFGHSPAVAGELGGILRRAGARVLLLHHNDGSTHARAANQFDAELYIGLMAVPEEACTASFYETDSFSSYGGKDLANFAIDALSIALRTPGEVGGTRSPVLRETRMPAVVFRLGPRDELANDKRLIGDAIHDSLVSWISMPNEDA